MSLLAPAMPSQVNNVNDRSGLVRWVEDRALLFLALILVVSAAVRVYGFRGYTGLDDGEYSRLAFQLAHGIPFPRDYAGPAVFPLRIGVFAPPAAIIAVFGLSEWAIVAYPFVISLASILLIYWSGAHFFSRGAGLLAAGLLGLFYWDIDSATRLLPDLPGAFFATAAIMLIAWSDTRFRDRHNALFLSGLCAGLLLGLSWLCKEAVAYLAPFCAIWIVLGVREHGFRAMRVWAGVAIGSGAVLLGESAFYYLTVGDPLFRMHEVERNYRQWPNGFFTEGSDVGWAAGTSYTAALINRLFVSGPSRILLDATVFSVPAIAVAATLIGWARRDRRYLIPGLWLCTLVLMFNFASSSMQSYVPLALYHRYLYPMFFPAIVLVAGFVWHALAATRWTAARFGDRVQQAAGVAAIAAICWGAAPTLYFNVVMRSSSWTIETRRLMTEIKPATVVYADALSLRILEFFEQFPAQTRWIEFDDLSPGQEIPPDSLVIVNKNYLEWLNRNTGMWVDWPAPGLMNIASYPMQSFFEKPPAGWRVVWRGEDAVLYRVDAQALHAAIINRKAS